MRRDNFDGHPGPNKSLEDNGGIAGSGVVGFVFMLWGFRAVPQLCRWAAQ
jgi:hypothetical protein